MPHEDKKNFTAEKLMISILIYRSVRNTIEEQKDVLTINLCQ